MTNPEPITVVVSARRQVARDIVEFTLARPDGGPLPGWEPGAHIDVLLADDTVRQYSLCSTPEDPGCYRIAVLREAGGRGGSIRMHETLLPGSTVAIRPPRNHFPLVRALEYILVAGGIGITPMLPLAAAAQHSGRPWRLVYTGGEAEAMAYADELRDLYGSAVTVHESGFQDRIDVAALLADARPGTAVFVCGPAGLIAAAEDACRELPAVDVFSERFAALATTTADDVAFEVSLARSGLILTVPPGRSILEMAEEHSVLAASSCREGACGTCETEVVSGEIDHRDAVLSPEERAEGESMMICVSRCAGGRLVLEL
ncbi:PDR/VanB family oxidoreductase [Nocardia macrotermitis]|uniref:Carnitine monooxygenase reductase subunit n=1 Tax=Nocardia macrotermitis TaxID=2585198 RepID=A0A7K0CY61_9NOCA|nr:PDR/VanB family oxidoreductase [Nocardia macrotermitis]MQY18383.1 Carnitine monooxygenase reductase subunit [Nocardia macrotermitis]